MNFCPIHVYEAPCDASCQQARREYRDLAQQLRNYWFERKNGKLARRQRSRRRRRKAVAA